MSNLLGFDQWKTPPQLYMELLEQEAQEDKDRRLIDYFNSIICASSEHSDVSKEDIAIQVHVIKQRKEL